jgi:cytochrome c553
MRYRSARSAPSIIRRGKRLLLPLFCLSVASFASAQGQGNLELRSLAATCAACHGTDGHPAPDSGLRALGQLPPGVLAARMRAYRENSTLASSVMAQIARGYDDQQVERLAAYFAGQP